MTNEQAALQSKLAGEINETIRAFAARHDVYLFTVLWALDDAKADAETVLDGITLADIAGAKS